MVFNLTFAKFDFISNYTEVRVHDLVSKVVRRHDQLKAKWLNLIQLAVLNSRCQMLSISCESQKHVCALKCVQCMGDNNDNGENV